MVNDTHTRRRRRMEKKSFKQMVFPSGQQHVLWCQVTAVVMETMQLVLSLLSFFLSYWGDTLPSHASAEACLTGWPNAEPQGRD